MALPRPSDSNTAVVTGASSGIGTEFAEQLAASGWHVTLVSRREPELEVLAARIEAAGGSAAVCAADLADRVDRTRLLDELAAGDRHVDILVNNAGRSTGGPVHRAEVDQELAMFELNVTAVVHLTTALLAPMVERGAGGILNVASVAGYQPMPGQAGYGATKAAVLSYTQAVHTELAGTGVAMTALCPGPVATEFAANMGLGADEAEKSLPKFMWVPADQVAKAGLDGLAANRMVVIPGVANRIGSIASNLAPKSILSPLIARQTPMLKGR